MPERSKGNPRLRRLVTDLYRASAEQDVALWKAVARRLERPRRNWSAVNLSRLERHAREGETCLVPGKLLGTGVLTKPVTVAAFGASAAAQEKVREAGGEVLTIPELIERNPKGSGVRLLG